jgi:WD40 repeat protein
VLSATLAHPRLDAFVERLDSHVEQLAFGPGRALAALTHDQTLVVWHDDGRRSVLWRRSNDESQSPFTRLAFTENGKRLAAAAENGDVLFWDLERNEPLPTVESGGTIASLAFSADGTRIAIGAADGAIAVWKIGTDRPLETLQSLPSSTSQHTLTFVGDSLRALTVTADALEIWDVTSGGRILVESDSPTLAPGAVLAWNGQSIAHANAQEVVIRPEITERAVVRIPLTITQGGISSLALSRDLKQVATGGQDGSVILWRVSDTNALGEWLVRGERQLRNLAWSHDGRRIAAIAEERTFLQWDVQEPRAQREIRSGAPLAGKAFTVHSLAFGPAEKLMAAVETDSVVSLVDVETGKPASAQGVSHDGGTSVVAIAADAKLVAAGGRDGQILLWNASTGGLRTTLEGRDTPPIKEGYGDPATEQTVITALAFSPDERRLVSVSGETASGARTIDMILWDLALSEPRPQRISQSPPVTAAAFNPTGTILALAAERDGMTTVTLWDTTQWRAVGQPWPDLRGVSSVAFSPDGKRLAMSTSEGIFLGDVDPRSWQQRACVMANRNFSCEEWRESVGTRPYKTVCPTLSSPRCESP